jgi:RHS repeat-associated protein
VSRVRKTVGWLHPNCKVRNWLSVIGAATASFAYSADGNRVKATFGTTTTTYVGAHYEKAKGTLKKYYYAGERRIALRTGGQTYYLFSDHLGSTHVSYRADAGATVVQRYFPWGAVRPAGANALPTTFTYTGQRVDETIGLMYYGARYYDPVLGRFIQPDTIVPDPGDPQSLNRCSYVGNRPTTAVDPSGHCVPDECPGVPVVEYPGSGTGLRGEAYVQWLYNLILWIDRERAATGGVYNVTSNLIQETAAHELNAFLMDDPEMLGDQLYQELLNAMPQLSATAAGAGASVLMSRSGRVLGAIRSAAFRPSTAAAGSPQTGITVYRVWGTEPADPDFARQSGPWGSSWTTTDPSTVPNYRAYAGLPSGGASGVLNAGRFVSVGIIRDPSGIQLRSALALDGQPGGLIEVLIPDPRTQIDLIGVYGVNPPY